MIFHSFILFPKIPAQKNSISLIVVRQQQQQLAVVRDPCAVAQCRICANVHQVAWLADRDEWSPRTSDDDAVVIHRRTDDESLHCATAHGSRHHSQLLLLLAYYN